MYDRKFYKKKQLLAQRDALLEEIGQEIFGAGDLPENFRLLPQEFQSMDILMEQIKDRYRLLKEERDRSQQEEAELVNTLSRLDREYARKLQQPRRDQDELNLKILHLRDQMRRGRRKPAEKLEKLEMEAVTLGEQIEGVEAAQKEAEQGFRDQLRSLRERLVKLDTALRRLLRDEEQQSVNRKKRLQDLAYHYYNCKLDKENFGVHYNRLDMLRTELADNRRVVTQTVELDQLAEEEEKSSWTWLIGLILIAAVVGYQFRTLYFVQENALPIIAARFMAEDQETRFFADFGRDEAAGLLAMIPSLAELPEGATLFQGLNRQDLQQALVSYDAEGALRMCGLRFLQPPPRFSSRLTQAGWRHLNTTANWHALSDSEDRWIWLILNTNEFLLFPRDELTSFEVLNFTTQNASLMVRMPLVPFGSNEPFLQGFNEMEMRMEDDHYTVTLTSSKPLRDLPLRKRALLMVKEQMNGENDVSFDGRSLVMRGAMDKWRPDSYRAADIRASIIGDMRVLNDNLADVEPYETTHANKNPSPGITSILEQDVDSAQRLLVMRSGDGAPRFLQEFGLGVDIGSMAFISRDRALILSDNNRHGLYKMDLDHNALKPGQWLNLAYDNGETEQIRPGMVVPSPDELRSIVLEKNPLDSSRPGMLLIRNKDLEPLWIERLPSRVGAALTASWNATGDTLYVGCASRRRIGRTAPALLIYHLQGDGLSLSQLINLPQPRRGATRVPAILKRESTEALFFYQYPQQKLMRLMLQEGLDAQTGLPLSSGLPPELVASPTLHFTRTQDHLLLLEPVRRTEDRASFVHLSKLSEAGPELAHSVDLGFTPNAALRLPLSDRFWVTGTDRRSLAALRIEEEKILVDQIHEMENLRPEQLASDPWGVYLFVTGKRDR